MSYNIKILIVNREQDAANSLSEILANIEDIEIIGEADCAEAALKKIEDLAPNVVLVDDDIPNGPYSLAEEISQRFAHTAVIVFVEKITEDDIRRLLQAGVNDLIIKPAESGEIVEAIFKAYEYNKKKKSSPLSKNLDEAPRRRTKVITVFSNKGGVGKTTTAVNLAVALANKHQNKTLLWDLDLYHGLVALATNISQHRHLTDLLNEIQYLDEDLLESYLNKHESSLMILPAPFTPEFADFVSAEHVGKIISVARERWDYIVIDASSFFSEPAIAAMRKSDLILLVGALDLGTIKNLKACMMVMDKLKIPRARVKLVLNRVSRESGISPKDIETALKMPVFAAIPADDKNVAAGLNQGIPTAYSNPTSVYGRSIQMLSEAVSGTKDIEQPLKGEKGLLGRWFSKKVGAGA